jgi:xanthosine utilization system XapX-like protein
MADGQKNRFGPSKSELKLRLLFSLGGLLLLGAALVYRGIPQGPALFEVIGVAGLFFGGTAIWTLRKLLRKEYSDGL